MTCWGPAAIAGPQSFLDISLKLDLFSVKKRKCLGSPDEKCLCYTRLFIIIKVKRQDGVPLCEDSLKELCAIGRRRAAHAVKNDVAAQNPDRM